MKSINDKGIIAKHGIQRIIYRYLKRHKIFHQNLIIITEFGVTNCRFVNKTCH
jgi:hypothetical protein